MGIKLHDVEFLIEATRLGVRFDQTLSLGHQQLMDGPDAVAGLLPTALKNAMEMVCADGHLLLQTPANNFFGHGFYQLGPDLFYRALSEENGFLIARMVLVEDTPNGRWHDVMDPQAIGCRVELINADRVMLLVQARRSRVVEVFKHTPQQSDYALLWKGGAPGAEKRIRFEDHLYNFRDAVHRRNRFLGRVAGFAIRQHLIPTRIRRKRRLGLRKSPLNTDFFGPIVR